MSTNNLLERIAVALERIAADSGTSHRTTTTRDERRLQALGLMPACKGNVTDIAKTIGCSRKVLYDDKELMEAVYAYRAGLSLVGGKRRRQNQWDEKDLE